MLDEIRHIAGNELMLRLRPHHVICHVMEKQTNRFHPLNVCESSLLDSSNASPSISAAQNEDETEDIGSSEHFQALLECAPKGTDTPSTASLNQTRRGTNSFPTPKFLGARSNAFPLRREIRYPLPASNAPLGSPSAPAAKAYEESILDQRHFVLGEDDEDDGEANTPLCTTGDWIGNSIITGVAIVLTPFVAIGALFGLSSLGARVSRK